MKKFSLSLNGVLLAILAIFYFTRDKPFGPKGEVEVYFSPRGGCTEACVRELQAAKEEVLVQAYSFTSVPIAKGLVEVHKRGVHTEALLDKSQRNENYTEGDFLAHAGIPTYIDDDHAIAHNKIIIIDRKVVVTGSFNFSKAAEQSNAENLVIIRDENIAKRYRDNWLKHKAHSERFLPKGG